MNGKNKVLLQWVLIIIAILGILGSVLARCVDIGQSKEKFNAYDGRIVKVESKNEMHDTEIGVIKADVRELKTDVKYIVTGIDDLKRAQGLFVRRHNDPNGYR